MGAVGAVTGICMAGAADAAYVLDEVVVIGNRDEERDVLPGNFVYTKSQTSFLAGKDTMDIPFSQMHFTEKSMDTFTGPDKPMDALLANSPSVRQSGSILHGDFFFRGFRTNGTNFYVNNVPGVFTQVFIVSEETGIISMAEGGRLVRHLDEASLRQILHGIYDTQDSDARMPLLHFRQRRKSAHDEQQADKKA